MHTKVLLFLISLLVLPVASQADVYVTLAGAKPKEIYEWQVLDSKGKKISTGTNNRKTTFDIPTVMFGKGYRGPYTIVISEYVGGPDERGKFKRRPIAQGTIHRAAGKITIKLK